MLIFFLKIYKFQCTCFTWLNQIILFTNQQLFSEPSWEFWLVEWSNIRNHDEILITAGDNIFMMYFAMSHDAEVYWLVHAELGCKQFVVIESYICTSIKRVITFNTHTSIIYEWQVILMVLLCMERLNI